MKRLLPYVSYLKPVRVPFIFALFCALVFGISSGFGLPFMMKFVFPRIFSPEAAELSWRQLIGYAAWLPGVFLIRGLSGYGNAYFINLCGVRVLERIRIDFFRRLQVLPLAFFQKRATGDLISRGLTDATLLQTTLTTVANEAVKQPVTLLGALGALVYLSIENRDVVFILLCLAIIPISVFPIRYIGIHLARRARQVQDQMGSVTDRLSENLGAIKEVRAFGLEEKEVSRFSETVVNLNRFQMKVVKYYHALSPAIEVLAASGIALAFIYAYHVRLPLETFIAMVGALYLSYDPVKKLGAIHNELKKGTGALDRLEAVFNEPVTIRDPERPKEVERLKGEIRFENVIFTYGGDPALRDVSTTLPPGTACALVGPSGAGKSTFANLVPRFYDPTSGRVTVDGHDLRELRLDDLRRHIALVSQHPVLFRDTVTANLRLGRLDATDAEVAAAARDAHAHEFIEALPDGYETVIGERGASLSGGQIQRLALARAFLRNAPILILDEATSALDAQSEEMIQIALRKLIRGKTVILIAHRFSTIRDADHILVFDQGRIIAEGNHDALYGTNELYRQLYDRQR